MVFANQWPGLGIGGVISGVQHTLPAGVKRLHVEDVNTLHLSEDFETFKTGGLVEVGGDGSLSSTGGKKVVQRCDF